MQNLYLSLTLLCLSFASLTAVAQPYTYTSKSNGTYAWNDNQGWAANSAPSYTPIRQNILITGVSIIQSNEALTLRGTNLRIGNGAMLFLNNDLRLEAHSINFFDTRTSTLTVDEGGTLVVKGDMYQSLSSSFINRGTTVVTGAYESYSINRTEWSGNQYFFNEPSYWGSPITAWDPAYADYYGGQAELAQDNPLLLDLINSELGPLPVVLLSYSAAAEAQGVAVRWVAESELNFSHYELYHSTDGENFSLLTSLVGVGTEVGPTSYEHMHLRAETGWNYYKLVAVDIDGSTEMHGVRSVFHQATSAMQSRVLGNPALNKQIRLNTAGLSSSTLVELYTTEGLRVHSKPLAENGLIHVPDAKAGLYLLRIQSPEGSTQERVYIQ